MDQKESIILGFLVIVILVLIFSKITIGSTTDETTLIANELKKIENKMAAANPTVPSNNTNISNTQTSTSFNLAKSLVGSMKVEIIANKNTLAEELGIQLISFQESIQDAFKRIEQNNIISSWKDSAISGRLELPLSAYISVPSYGCFFDKRVRKVNDVKTSEDKIWAIGGETGWYYGTWLWKIRGFMDKLIGGVGLRRGRTHPDKIFPGDALDFWRVLLADKKGKRLLLFAEMKLPGEAWLEFRISDNKLIQTATFRPLGLLGRLYWYSVLPFHGFIFKGMINKLTSNY